MLESRRRSLPDPGRYEWDAGSGDDSLDGFDWVRDKSFKNAVVAFNHTIPC